MRKQVTYLGNILCYEIENLNKPVCICFHGMNMTREMYKTDQLQHLLKNYSLVLAFIFEMASSRDCGSE